MLDVKRSHPAALTCKWAVRLHVRFSNTRTLFSCRKTYMFTRQLLLSTNRHAYLYDVQLSGFPCWRTTLALLLGSIRLSSSTCDYHNTPSAVTLSQAHSGLETSAGTFQKQSIQILMFPDILGALCTGRKKEKICALQRFYQRTTKPQLTWIILSGTRRTCIFSNPVMEILRVGGMSNN